jgi:PST family polysaccharide transporter
MGIGAAIVQMKHITKEHISLSYTLSIVFGIVIGILFYVLAPYVGQFFNLDSLEAPIRFFSFFFPLKSFNSVSLSILQRELKFSAIVKSHSIAYLLGYGLTAIVLALLGFGLWSLIYGQLAILIVQTIILLVYTKPSFSLFNSKKIYNDLLFFGSGYTLDTNFNFFAENSDNIIVGKFLGATSLGIYSRAFQFLSLPASFFGKIYDNVLYPILSSKQDDTEKLSYFYIFSISFCLLVLFPVSLMLLLNAELLVRILLGDQWLDVIAPFQILIIGFCFRFGTRINKSFLKSLGLVYKGALYQFIFASLMISLCMIGVTYYGIIGVSVAVLIATITNYLQVAYRIQKLLDFDFKYFLGLHLKTFMIYIPLYIIAFLTLYFNANMYVTIATTCIILIPTCYILFKHENSIFHYKHNTVMFNQLVDNSPKIVNKIAIKLRLKK